ncbi:MAG TPA: 16S rRNA (guanine(966)-N(2))-methyltransferase RsmD [Candidatus Omnitrophota bacterium]|nr:16S rRNA (guanine(966)-N(2))-methyltransferase RsmD [Candidatus Omnitrophota bacterium]HPT06580.1 16S rRNA (guanine(966)-N(2))-methyltransferase RsmD [Candidatus Omnitrophota bacterium]
MRILTGINKGRNLNQPSGIRPTQNVVRKALFDILGDVEGLSFLELFAGSGAVGFEAVSRGVKDLVFVEYNSECVRAIQKNIDGLKLYSCCLYQKEAGAAIKDFHQEKRLFDIIFLDPPYYHDIPKNILHTLGAYDILSPDGLIVVQHVEKDTLPETLGDLTLLREKKYGKTFLAFYGKQCVK